MIPPAPPAVPVPAVVPAAPAAVPAAEAAASKTKKPRRPHGAAVFYSPSLLLIPIKFRPLRDILRRFFRCLAAIRHLVYLLKNDLLDLWVSFIHIPDL